MNDTIEAGRLWNLIVTSEQLDLIDQAVAALPVPAGQEDDADHLRANIGALRAHIDSHKVEAPVEPPADADA